MKPMAPYLAVLAADFYLLPLLIRGTGSAMLFLLAVMPLAVFAPPSITAHARAFVPGFP